MRRATIVAPDLTPPVGPFAQAVWAGDLLFGSGQVGQDSATGKIVEGGLEAEIRQAFANIERVLAAAGLGLEHIVKTQVFLTDLSDFPVMNTIYGEMFSAPFPARTTVQVAKLALGALVEIDFLARRP